MNELNKNQKNSERVFWSWKVSSEKLNLGESFSKFKLFEQEDGELNELHKKLEAYSKNGKKRLFQARTTHQNEEQPFVLEWTGEVVEWSDEGNPVLVSGYSKKYAPNEEVEPKDDIESLLFHRLLDNIRESIYFKDLKSRFILISKACAGKFGIDDPSDAVGKTDFDYFDEEHARPAFEDEKRVMETETPIFNKEEKEVYPGVDGEVRWGSTSKMPLYDDERNLIGTFGITKDITKQRKAEEQLKESNVKFSRLSEQVPGFFYMYESFPDGRSCFPLASEGIRDIYELAPEEVKESTEQVTERVHKDDLRRVVTSIRKSMQTLENWNCEYRVVLPKKGLRWVRGRAKPEKRSDGSIVGYGYITDITRRKRKEIELNESLDIIGEQNKRLMNFAHIVSHNLRNHAGNISMLLSLHDMEESEEEQEELLEHLKIASNRLNETISDLNEIVDKQNKLQADFKEINIRDYVAKIKEILTSEILAHNVKFNEEIPEDINLNYNPSYLESIILNLLSNAIKYRHPERTPEIEIRAYQKDEHVYLEISDNGLGIDLDKHGDKLFGMYNTFHDNENSKGIGLFITKNQIESMGGSITVHSEPDKGTTFKIILG